MKNEGTHIPNSAERKMLPKSDIFAGLRTCTFVYKNFWSWNFKYSSQCLLNTHKKWSYPMKSFIHFLSRVFIFYYICISGKYPAHSLIKAWHDGMTGGWPKLKILWLFVSAKPLPLDKNSLWSPLKSCYGIC